ncbi:MAG: putative rane protein, partial [Myxococcaceae bacterium]|nr:putative rane protein [Myxococcaceae bacterium]
LVRPEAPRAPEPATRPDAVQNEDDGSQAAAPEEEEPTEPPLPFLAWLGFIPGASFQPARRAASLALVGCAVLLGSGEVFVGLREVRTNTRVSGEQRLLAGGRSFAKIQVTRPNTGEGLAGAEVRASLVAGSKRFPMFEGKTDALGVVQAPLDLPDEELGAAQLEVTTSARGEEDVVRMPVTVGRDFKVHLSTDKPLYQPGQAIHVRALALESRALTPAKDRELVFEVFDPKNNRLAGKTIKASRFGIAAWDVELSSELALGDYRVSVQLGSARAEVPVKVARYTLPKFKLALKGTRDTFLAGETLRAQLSTRYFFGKPVAGARVHAVLVREDGTLVGAELNGTTEKNGELTLQFELPAQLAAPGQPERLRLQVEVTDAAGQQEQKGQGFTVARELLAIELLADQGGVADGLPNTLYVLTTTPEGLPVPCEVTLTPSSGPDLQLRTGQNGVGAVTLPVLNAQAGTWVEAHATGADGQRASRKVFFERRDADFHLDTDRALYRPGEPVNVKVTARGAADSALTRLYQDGRVVHSQSLTLKDGTGALNLPATLAGALELEVTLPGASLPVSRRLVIAEPRGLAVTMTADAQSHRPGATAKLRFEVKDAQGKPKPSALGISVVDESLWALTASNPSQARAFFLLDRSLQAPRGQLSAADLLAGQAFTEADQLAGRLLLSSAAVAPRAPAYFEESLRAEYAVLSQQRATWERFSKVAFQVLLAAFALLVALAMGRFAKGWFVPVLWVAITIGALFVLDGREAWTVLRLCLAGYVVSAVVQSVSRRAVAWSYLGVPVLLACLVFVFFGDNLRRLFSMSADSLAGHDDRVMAMRAPAQEPMLERKKMMNFGEANDYAEDKKDMAPRAPSPAAGLAGIGAAPPPRREVRVRQNFPETMYVQPELVTDEAGVATLELPLADSITDWRLSALASSMDGALGAMNAPLRVFQDFFVDLDTPVALVKGDSATMQIAVHNYLTTEQTIRLEVKAEAWFQVVGPSAFSLKLEGGGVGGHELRLKVLKPGLHTLTVQADGTALSDAVARQLRVSEAGQQKTAVVSGTLTPSQTTRVAITVPEGAVASSVSLMLKVFPSRVASALEGLEGSLQAPHGCFEQTSSTTYPNVLIWDYLQRAGKKSPVVEDRARGFVALGYQKLLSFEVSGGGFEWFGRSPANQVLTAYGLMEFKDMSRVFPVDEKMMLRTQAWLVSRQQPDGSWDPDRSSLSDGLWKSGFDGRLMVSAYVTWALVESGYQGPALAPALAFLASNVEAITDSYTLAMMAATFGRANHPGSAAVVKKLVAQAKREKDLAWFAPAEATLYYGRGIGGTIESTALAAYALMVTKQEPELVRSLLKYVAANRDARGSWHTTQGTVLALRALLFATSSQSGDHALKVRVNGAEAGELMVTASADAPALADLAGASKVGLNVVEVTGDSEAQFQVVAVYTQPWREKSADDTEPLSLKVDYGRTKAEVGAIVPVDLQVTYRGTDASGMVVLSLGLPAGLAALQEDLQALVTAGAVARFELEASAVNLYFDRLVSKSPQRLSLRLKATSKVDTQGVGSSTWLYYHPAVRAVAAAIPVQIN